MKISIITVTYNSEKTLRDTLQCIAGQTYAPIEHIIIDGKSNDNTMSIVKKFPHIAKAISEPDKGIYDAMNKGISNATGEVIGILNSDDIFASNDIIEQIASIFKSDADLAAVYGNIEFFKRNDINKIVRFWKTKPYYNTFFEDGEVPPHPSLFVRKSVYEKIGTYFPDFKIASDHEFMFRMLKVHGFKSFFLNKTIVKMRIGGVSTGGVQSFITSSKELKKVWEMNGYKYPLNLYYLRPFKKIRQLIFKNN